MKSISQMITECERLEPEDLTPWECGFINTVLKLHRSNRQLTAAQAECLERIHRKHFS